MWAFMKAMPWESMGHEYIRIVAPKIGEGQPQRFIPVFDEYSDAEKFAGESDKHLIVEIKVIT